MTWMPELPLYLVDTWSMQLVKSRKQFRPPLSLVPAFAQHCCSTDPTDQLAAGSPLTLSLDTWGRFWWPELEDFLADAAEDTSEIQPFQRSSWRPGRTSWDKSNGTGHTHWGIWIHVLTHMEMPTLVTHRFRCANPEVHLWKLIRLIVQTVASQWR